MTRADAVNCIWGKTDECAREWGFGYKAGNPHFVVGIGAAAAVRIDYTVTPGGTFSIFGETTTAAAVELGILALPDGTIPVLTRVTVTYLPNGVFTAWPDNAKKDAQGNYTHFLRVADDGQVWAWWPSDAAFVFGGDTQQKELYGDGVIRVCEITAGALVRPEPVIETTPATSCKAAGAPCTSACPDPINHSPHSAACTQSTECCSGACSLGGSCY